MKSEPKVAVPLEELQQQSNAVIDDFEQQKEAELVNLLVKIIIHITFGDYEKSDKISAF